jgi:hypothetical protein
MSLVDTRVSVHRPTRTRTSGGGKAVTYTLVPLLRRLVCRQNFYAKDSLKRIEDAGGDGQGVINQELQLFTFDRSEYPSEWPDIRREDKIIDDNGVGWKVLHVRNGYEMTMQVDRKCYPMQDVSHSEDWSVIYWDGEAKQFINLCSEAAKTEAEAIAIAERVCADPELLSKCEVCW